MPEDEDEVPREDPKAGLRKLSGAQELRALAHPVRIALLELLGVEGALTATEAAKVIGGTPANAAYHLRTLAKHGYVVEAEGGVGRERPWRISSVGMVFSDDDSDPAVTSAAGALEAVLSERWFSRAEFYREHRAKYSERVREISGSSQFVLYGTIDEIEEAHTAVMLALTRFQERLADPSLRPEGAMAYEFVVSAHPFDLAAFGAEEPTGKPTEESSAESSAESSEESSEELSE